MRKKILIINCLEWNSLCSENPITLLSLSPFLFVLSTLSFSLAAQICVQRLAHSYYNNISLYTERNLTMSSYTVVFYFVRIFFGPSVVPSLFMCVIFFLLEMNISHITSWFFIVEVKHV